MFFSFFDRIWGHSGPKPEKWQKNQNWKNDIMLILIVSYDPANDVLKKIVSRIPNFGPFMGP